MATKARREAADVQELRHALLGRGLDTADIPDRGLLAVIRQTGDAGVAEDALAMEHRPAWLARILADDGVLSCSTLLVALAVSGVLWAAIIATLITLL
jgi:hypothetical protein